jgi:hypothetical protein
LRGQSSWQVEPQREVRLQTRVHHGFKLRQHLHVEGAAATLISESGIGEAIAQHRHTGIERGLDRHSQVIAPRRKHQQRLCQRIHRLVQHQRAKRLGQRRAAWLARHQDLVAALAQPSGQRLDVRRLAGAVDAFKGDEAASDHYLPPRWNWFTARLWSVRFSEKTLEPSPRATK